MTFFQIEQERRKERQRLLMDRKKKKELILKIIKEYFSDTGCTLDDIYLKIKENDNTLFENLTRNDELRMVLINLQEDGRINIISNAPKYIQLVDVRRKELVSA